MPPLSWLMAGYPSAVGTKPESLGGGNQEMLMVFCFYYETDGYKRGYQEAINFNKTSQKKWKRMMYNEAWSGWQQI